MRALHAVFAFAAFSLVAATGAAGGPPPQDRYSRMIPEELIRTMDSMSAPEWEALPVPSRDGSGERVVGGLRAWWPLDGSGREAVTGAPAGSVVGDVRPVSGRAMHFGGNGSAVLLPDSADLAFTESFTLSVWLKADRLPAWQGLIFFRGDNRGSLDPYFLALEGNGMIRLVVEPDIPGRIAYVDAPIPVKRWVHVAAVYNARVATLRLYVNGKEAAEAATAYRPFRDLNPAFRPGVAIGNTQDPAVSNQPFIGTLRDLQVYDRALMPEEVAVLCSSR